MGHSLLKKIKTRAFTLVDWKGSTSRPSKSSKHSGPGRDLFSALTAPRCESLGGFAIASHPNKAVMHGKRSGREVKRRPNVRKSERVSVSLTMLRKKGRIKAPIHQRRCP